MKSIASVERLSSLLLAGFLPVTGIASAQDPSLPSSLFLEPDHPLAITLTMDFRRILRDVGDASREHSALLCYRSEEDDTVTVPVQVRVRLLDKIIQGDVQKQEVKTVENIFRGNGTKPETHVFFRFFDA